MATLPWLASRTTAQVVMPTRFHLRGDAVQGLRLNGINLERSPNRLVANLWMPVLLVEVRQRGITFSFPGIGLTVTTTDSS